MHTPINQCTSDCRHYGCPDDEIMEILADDQMKHSEPPTEEEMEGMYDALVGSASEEYQTAH
jgi:hypothetical protein